MGRVTLPKTSPVPRQVTKPVLPASIGRLSALKNNPALAAIGKQIADQIAKSKLQGPEQQKIQDFSKAQQAGAAKQTGAVDFKTMTQAQQYDYLQKTTVQQAAGDQKAWKTGDREVNLVGIRSFANGQAGSKEGNAYNDTIYACRMVDGKKTVESFKASVDGGVFKDPKKSGLGFYDRKGKYKGITHLADGFYRDAFKRGKVSGKENGLRQQGLVRLHADKNNDGVIQNREKLGRNDQGMLAGARHQIQFHRGADGDKVGESSAGCQAIRPDDWKRFQNVMADAPKGQDSKLSGKGFSYLLTDSSKLPPPDSNFQALRRSQVDQRTVFQKRPGLFSNDPKDRAMGKGIIDEDMDNPFTRLQGFSDRDRSSHIKNREFETDPNRNSNSGNSWLNMIRQWTYGDGVGIVRTPDKMGSSFRADLFTSWLRF